MILKNDNPASSFFEITFQLLATWLTPKKTNLSTSGSSNGDFIK